MAKKQAKRTPKGKKKAPQRSQALGPVKRLDADARAFARLLNDPCYGKIVGPIYQSSGTGLFVRLESDFIIGAEATAVGSACIFVPGLISTGGEGLIQPLSVVTSDTSAISWTPNTTNQCGATFAGSTSSVRAVAACLQVSFVGSELNRAGVISLAQMTKQTAMSYTTLAKLRSGAERVVRVPDGVLEIKLSPMAKNADFQTTTSTALTDTGEMPALVMSCSGIPASTGVRVRLIQVVEWTPAAGAGVTNPSTAVNSSSSLQTILGAMTQANPQWQYDLLTGLGAYAAKAVAWL